MVLDPTGEPLHETPSVGATNWTGGLAATRHLLEQALPVSLHAVEPFDCRVGPEAAVDDAAQRRRHLVPSRTRLHEKVFDAPDERAHVVRGAVRGRAAAEG